MIKTADTKQREHALTIIENLYDKIVPEYLLEDHPPEIPETAQKLIKQVANAKGNGMEAEQLDIELSNLFRNARNKGHNNKIKQHDSGITRLQNHKIEEFYLNEELKQFVAEKKAYRAASEIRRRVKTEEA